MLACNEKSNNMNEAFSLSSVQFFDCCISVIHALQLCCPAVGVETKVFNLTISYYQLHQSKLKFTVVGSAQEVISIMLHCSQLLEARAAIEAATKLRTATHTTMNSNVSNMTSYMTPVVGSASQRSPMYDLTSVRPLSPPRPTQKFMHLPDRKNSALRASSWHVQGYQQGQMSSIWQKVSRKG